MKPLSLPTPSPYGRITEFGTSTSLHRPGRVPEWFRDSPAKRVTRVRFPPRPLLWGRGGIPFRVPPLPLCRVLGLRSVVVVSEECGRGRECGGASLSRERPGG